MTGEFLYFTISADCGGVVGDDALSALEGGDGGGASQSDKRAEKEGGEFHGDWKLALFGETV